MKVYLKKINCLAWSNKEGNIEPIRFDFKGKTYGHIQILYHTTNKIAGNPQHIFGCIAECNNRKYECELRYEVKTCIWYLYKI
ncbi:hypothetical protein [Vallitalea guaymasensis]|uniref:hypothetical protein n=1 Tax=Vallitalea guaymasensis TaxID=1185412 RepID=UPI000DE32166|nr:hypothetical protein [Vallitalea guaymasensis]